VRESGSLSSSVSSQSMPSGLSVPTSATCSFFRKSYPRRSLLTRR